MLKKAILVVFTLMIIAFGTASNSMAQSIWIDGLVQDWPTVVNPGALGDSLVYGYYNVRGNLNLFNVVNTSSADGAKVRVVFRAAKNSAEVLDFAVCLSKGDVWTAYLVDNGSTAAICPFDTDTVTAPALPSTCQPFIISAGSNLTNDDLREGYFEVLGFSSIPGYDKNKSDASTTFGISGNYIKTPSDCANWYSAGSSNPYAGNVGDVLMGNNTIFDLSTLATFSYNATAVANSSPIPVLDPGPGSEVDLVSVGPYGCSALEEMLMKTNIISPYDLLTGIGGETEIIMTFPTRKSCHEFGTGGLFSCKTADESTNKCTAYATPIDPSVWDDKENRQEVLGFSPAGAKIVPNEINVLKLGASNIWSSTVAQSFTVNGQLGWVNISLTSQNAPYGLPVIAYTTQSFVNGAASYIAPAAYPYYLVE